MKKEKTLKKIDKIIMSVLIVFIIVSFGLSAVFTYYKAQNKMVSIFGYSICYVLTGSMKPALNTGDVILIKNTEPENIVEGDIITFRSTALNDNYVTHRVYSIQDVSGTLLFTTKGDANDATDTEILTAESIEGVFQKKLIVMGFILSILSNKIVFLLLVILPLFVSLILQLINFVVTLKTKDENKKIE